MAGRELLVDGPAKGDVFSSSHLSHLGCWAIIIGAIFVSIAAYVISVFTLDIPNRPNIIEPSVLQLGTQGTEWQTKIRSEHTMRAAGSEACLASSTRKALDYSR